MGVIRSRVGQEAYPLVCLGRCGRVLRAVTRRDKCLRRQLAVGWHNAVRAADGVIFAGGRNGPGRALGGTVSAPFVLAPGQRHPGAPPLDRPFFRFASGQTDGLLALAEVRLPPRTPGPTLHVHANEDEMFFVLDGVMTVQVGDEVHEVAAGGLAWGARRSAHLRQPRHDADADNDHVASGRSRGPVSRDA